MKTIILPRFYGVFFAFFKQLFLIVSLLLFVQACTDDPDEIGLDLYEMDGQFEVKLEVLDTLTIEAVTAINDSMFISQAATNILGIINDPVFGKSRASIYTETRLPMNNLSLGEAPVLDSIHLVLIYSGDYYGKLQTFQNLQVYELSENFPEKDTLYSTLEIPHYPELITKDPTGFLFRPAPEDSIMVDTILQAPQIRIPLSDAFGQKFIDANDTETFANVPNYLETFKGLYITVEDDVDGMGSKFKLNMLANISSLELFYHNEGDTIQHMRRFLINDFAKRATRMEHFEYDNAHELLRAQILEQDQSVADSLLFLQSLGALRANIQIPFFEAVADIPRLLINKAELVVPVAEGFASEELPLSKDLMLIRINEQGQLRLLDDYFVGASYFGGRLDEDKMQYTFNISMYFQQLLDGHFTNEELALLVGGLTDDMSRVVLHGPGRVDNPMRLVIYYSVFD